MQEWSSCTQPTATCMHSCNKAGSSGGGTSRTVGTASCVGIGTVPPRCGRPRAGWAEQRQRGPVCPRRNHHSLPTFVPPTPASCWRKQCKHDALPNLNLETHRDLVSSVGVILRLTAADSCLSSLCPPGRKSTTSRVVYAWFSKSQ